MKNILNCCSNKNYCYKKIKNISTAQQIANICEFEYEYFLNKSNVHAIGLGFKKINGIYTNKLCLSVFVSKKLPLVELTPSNHIPPVYKFIETDVIENSLVSLSDLGDKVRPAIGGVSIGTELSKGAGTLGALVTDGNDLFILSNNHVLAESNSAPPFTKILQPAIMDGGKSPNDVIAVLAKFIPLNFKQSISSKVNLVDCALAKVIVPSSVSPAIKFLGVPKGVMEPQLKSYVQKVGRSTGISGGIITNTNVTFKTSTNGKTIVFKKQIISNMHNEKGDSGSLVLNEKKFGVGLLIGEMNGFTVFSPLRTVLNALKVTLITQ